MAFYLGKDKQKITISEAMLGSGTTRPTQTKSESYTKNGNYSIKPDSGYVLSSVNVEVSVPPKEEQEKSITATTNKTYTITPDYGKALSKATIEVAVPLRYDEGYNDGQEAGYAEGKADGITEGYEDGYRKGYNDNEPILETLNATENIKYTPSEGVDGFSSVVVNVPLKYDEGFAAGRLEGYEEGYQNGLDVNDFITATLEVTENNKTYIPEDYDVDGFSSVVVAVPERYNEGLEDGKVIGREEGYNDGKADGIIEGVASIKIQEEKTVTVSGTVEPDDGYDAMKKVIVNISDESGSSKIEIEEEFNVYASDTYEFVPDEGYTYSKVTVNVEVPTEDPDAIRLIDRNVCGDGCEYTLYADGRIILECWNDGNTGSYTTENYATDNPIYEHRNNIQTVIIDGGITKIGSYSFCDCGNIKRIIIPASVTEIEENAFLVDVIPEIEIIYLGTKEQWDNIIIGHSNDMIEMGTLICQYEEPIGGGAPTTTETWTFEMEDGSIITKEVVVA